MKRYILAIAVLVLGLQVNAQINVDGGNDVIRPIGDAPFFISPIGGGNARNATENLDGKGINFPQVNLTEVTTFGNLVSGSVLPGPGHNFRTFLDGLVVYNIGEGYPHPSANIGNVQGGRFTPGFWFYDNSGARGLQGVTNAERLVAGTWRPVASGGGWIVGGNPTLTEIDEPAVLGTGGAPIIVEGPVRVWNAERTAYNMEVRAIMHIGHGAITP